MKEDLKDKSVLATSKLYIHILKNALYLFIGAAGSRGINAIVIVLLARYLGPREYGALAIGLTFSSLVSYFTDLGLSQTFIREGSKQNANLSALAYSSLKIRLILAIMVTIVTAIIVPILYADGTLQKVILGVSLPTIWGTMLQNVSIAYFQVNEKMKYTACVGMVSSLLTAGLLVLGIMEKQNTVYFAYSYGVAQVVSGVLGIIILLKQEKYTSEHNLKILEELGSFLLGGILIILLPSVSLIILSKVMSLREVGFYNLAFKIPAFLYSIPVSISAAFYPVLFKLGHLNKHESILLGINQMKLTSIIGLILTLLLISFPTYLFATFFGAGWVEETPITCLKIMGWLVVVASLNYPLGDILTTQNLQNRRNLCLGVTLVVSLALNYVLGTAYQAVGGAVATLMTEICFLVLLIYQLPYKKILLTG